MSYLLGQPVETAMRELQLRPARLMHGVCGQPTTLGKMEPTLSMAPIWDSSRSSIYPASAPALYDFAVPNPGLIF